MSTAKGPSFTSSIHNEVDDALKVLREVQGEYGVIVNDLQIAKMSGADKNGTLAFYDAGGNLAVNENYFDLGKLNQSYDEDVQAGFHPSRGNKSAMEAVVAHEMGHRLTDEAGNIAGNGFWSLDKTSNDIVSKASKTLGISHGELRSRISGYAKSSNAETVAEAFADMYCNGNNASSASRAVINELSKYFD